MGTTSRSYSQDLGEAFGSCFGSAALSWVGGFDVIKCSFLGLFFVGSRNNKFADTFIALCVNINSEEFFHLGSQMAGKEYSVDKVGAGEVGEKRQSRSYIEYDEVENSISAN